MDTLASNADKTPFKPVTKIIPLLHCHSVLCPLGALQLHHALFQYIDEQIICHDIDDLVHHLNENIPAFFSWASEIWKHPLKGTIYILGYSLVKQTYRSFAFRSLGNSATIDELPQGFIARPPTGIIDKETLMPLIPFDLNDIPSSLAMAILKMKEVDDNIPSSEKVGIGCHVQVALISNKGYTLTTVEMPDYIQTYNKCCENIPNRQL